MIAHTYKHIHTYRHIDVNPKLLHKTNKYQEIIGCAIKHC